jgi:hypothetical protein
MDSNLHIAKKMIKIMIFWIMLLIFIYIAEYLNLNRGMYFESSNKINTIIQYGNKAGK